MTQTTVDAPSKDRAQIPARTLRKDRYWLSPLFTFAFFTAWVVYATVRSMMGSSFWVEKYHYLTPFYSPCVSKACPPGAADFGRFVPAHLPFFIPYALISLPFLLGFRLTCYYYRKSYYRAFFWDPPACAVREPHRGRYRGETTFPWVFSNLHRFFLYLSIVVVAVLWYDALVAFTYQGRLYLGLGSLILLVNVIFLSLYTLSCHSLRHLLGGNLDCYSCVAAGNARHGLWSRLSQLNRRHGLYAWLSLFSVLFADVYVRFFAAAVEHLPVVH
jgi:hypothetical protein